MNTLTINKSGDYNNRFFYKPRNAYEMALQIIASALSKEEIDKRALDYIESEYGVYIGFFNSNKFKEIPK